MEWVRGKILGHGSFATVSLAKPKKQNTKLPQLVALKSCQASHSSSLINEKTVLEDLSDCPNIIQCFGSDLSYQNGKKMFNLLLEYAFGGSLSDKLQRSGDRKLQESELRRYTRSILKGLLYIHNKGYVHCDIKPQNILLCSCKDGDTAKIGDLGLAKKAGLNKKRDKLELRGTPMYMSPEMAFSGEQEAPSDIWAFGCLVVEMAAGIPAWRFPVGADVARLLMTIGVREECPEIPKELSSEGKDFLEKCFVRDSSKRWTAQMLLDHPFVANYDHDFDRVSISIKSCQFENFSSSPKCPFDFPDWDEELSSEVTSLASFEFDMVSAMDRVSELAGDHLPDWSVRDSWLTVR